MRSILVNQLLCSEFKAWPKFIEMSVLLDFHEDWLTNVVSSIEINHQFKGDNLLKIKYVFKDGYLPFHIIED